ncbi:MAG: nicotinate-nucleotide adenylyltransferase [Anaerolineales bacterium]|nr:nicotinate-nucleotide adenylyltransferase [Anaerolineales bacterium]
MRLGIFGGTFDPPHIGHLILAAEALDQLSLDRVLWVLTLEPPHKQGWAITPLQHRLDMVLAAIGKDPFFELSRVEIDRDPPHYAVDTVRLLGQKYPNAELVYLMGGDSLKNLPGWYKPEEFVNQCHSLGVMRRAGSKIELNNLENQIPGITSKVEFMDTPGTDISASNIRERIRDRHHYQYFLPSAVYEIIQNCNLYGVPDQMRPESH